MVSKNFKALCESPALDKTLFRRVKALAPNHKLDDANAVKLHPAFKWLSCRCNDRFEDIQFASTKGDKTKTWELAKTSAAKEYANMPALKKLQLKIIDFKEFTIKRNTGVTMIDILAAIWEHVFNSGAVYYQGEFMEPVTGKADTTIDFD